MRPRNGYLCNYEPKTQLKPILLGKTAHFKGELPCGACLFFCQLSREDCEGDELTPRRVTVMGQVGLWLPV